MKRSALSLVIRRSGKVSSEDIDKLLERLNSKRSIEIDKKLFSQAVKAATAFYRKEHSRLFVCTDKPCAKRSVIETSNESLVRLSAELGCSVVLTGCHWRCDKAPVLTLKVGEEARRYLRCITEFRLDEVLESVKELVHRNEPKPGTDSIAQRKRNRN